MLRGGDEGPHPLFNLQDTAPLIPTAQAGISAGEQEKQSGTHRRKRVGEEGEMKAPITDKTLGVNVSRGNDEKFAGVRQKARDEYVERCKRRKKDKKVAVPAHKPGELVVTGSGRWHDYRGFMLVEIVDYTQAHSNEFEYYGIVMRVSNKKHADRIGRLTSLGRWFSPEIINVPPDSIKWMEAE